MPFRKPAGKQTFSLLSMILCASVALAQQSAPPAMDQMPGMSHPVAEQHEMSSMKGMQHDNAVAQYGSGTSWRPASTPEYMWMGKSVDWTLMAHANAFLTYNQQGGPQGVGKLESENWLMLMEQHPLGRARLEFRQMFSAEPFTAPKPGFPQLFQTGETYRGAPLLNHQHPHDFIGEMAALLTVPLNDKVDWVLYGGPAGEPALGPVAFVHRASAINDPSAPLSHHVQDSTHITYGLVTTALRIDRFRVEGSVFNGREPDEHRYDFDFAPLDSWSVRFSAAPTHNWTAQYSYGHLTKPEALEPGDVLRQTASVAYNRPVPRGNWATSLIYGRNRKLVDSHVQSSYLLESNVDFAEKNSVFTRLELVDKDELVPGANFRIGAYTFGGVRNVAEGAYGQVGVGADVTFYSKPATLDATYGKNLVSFQLFLRFRPPAMKH
jgi:hypothetical protein